MAEFAKAQLLKYGWTEGKGLGKNESGIPEAIRPKLKFDHAGIGHDPAEQFTYHWWENVFNEAAKNITVQSDNDGVSMNVIDKDTVEITTKKSSLKALKKSHATSYGNFLKTATLLHDGKVVDENCKEPESTDSLAKKIKHVQLTDEALFKACGGRTAHKGARHGLNLNGKLARIAEQEKQLLAKMNPNKAEKIDSSSNISLGKEYSHDFEMVKSRKRVKSKRKMMKTDPESVARTLVNGTDPQPSCSYTIDPEAEENLDALKSKRKTKKSKKNNCELTSPGNPFRDVVEDDSSGLDIVRANQSGLDDNANTIEQDEEFVIPLLTEEPVQRTKSKKSRKKEKRKMNELMEKLDTSCVIDESMKIAKKRRREESHQIVEDILSIALEKCAPLDRKCKKIKLEENSDSKTYYDADKMNAKILKKKKHSHRKRRKDKLDRITMSITEELMSVNLDENCEKKENIVKKELIQTPTDSKAHDTKRTERRYKRQIKKNELT